MSADMLVAITGTEITTQLGGTGMEWEEELLMIWGGEIPSHPAAYYRRQAARAREMAEEVTTRAIKARLPNDAVHFDQLAAKADFIAIPFAALPIEI
jgi:hypothetical protein